MDSTLSPTPIEEPIRLSDGTEIHPNPPPEVEPEPRPKASWPVVVLAAIAVLAVLYVARDVIVPVVVALMLAPPGAPASRL